MEPKFSKPFSMIDLDWKKVGTGALIAIAGALLTYISEVITGINFGSWTPVVVTVWSVAANIARKYLTGTLYKF